MAASRRRPRRKVFPSYEKLIEAALVTYLEIQKIDATAAAAGGLAMQIWGSDRLTADVDLIVSTVPPRWQRSKPLSFGGVQVEVHDIPVDLIYRSDEFSELYNEALIYAEVFDDVLVPVVTPEYLVAMKTVAGRPKDELDLNYLLAGPDVELDYEEASRIVKKHLGKQSARDLKHQREVAIWLREKEEKSP